MINCYTAKPFTPTDRRRPQTYCIAIFVLGVVVLLSGCAASGSLRPVTQDVLDQTSGATCTQTFHDSDERIKTKAEDFSITAAQRNTFLDTESRAIRNTVTAQKVCWRAGLEHHEQYDLFYAEFDDQGNPSDIAQHTPVPQSQLHLIEASLPKMLANIAEARADGLNIVVFTHGWHGNPRADDSYSIEFRAMLMDIASREAKLKNRKNTRAFRTVGIEIAWRGDSFENPPLPFAPSTRNAANVWDRKLAAETISKGAVQELFAFLNQFYLDHSCRTDWRKAQAEGDHCGDVHLMAMGHSYGALIDYHSLVSRIQEGLNVDQCHRVYGFGNLTVLLNPAFEGARYRSVFTTAVNRPSRAGDYFGDGPPDPVCKNTAAAPQIPTIVTLQSLGDSATGTLFPILMRVTTPFSQTLSTEETFDKDHAIGWIPGFRTHTLKFDRTSGAVDKCLPSSTGTKGYCPFQAITVETDPASAASSIPLTLALTAASHDEYPIPNYFPVWSVAVDKEIMVDHDDFWNPHIIRLISLLFADAYEQSEKFNAMGKAAL